MRKTLLARLSVYLLVGWVSLFARSAVISFLVGTTPLFAATAQVQLSAGWESYLDRPDILKIEPMEQRNLGEAWKKLKPAHFSFVAQLLEMYPKDTQIYFLARDPEYLFDAAKLVTEGTEDFKRIHLAALSFTHFF